MSVTEIVAKLRQAYALVTQARREAARAADAITDGAAIVGAATAGSTQPHVDQITHHARAAGDDVQTADAMLRQAQDVIDAYCHSIAGHGIAEAGGGTSGPPSAPHSSAEPSTGPQPPPPPPDHTADPGVKYADWIAELRRSGTKISTDKIVRMTRLRNGRLVWLETGTKNSGLGHVMSDGRPEQFEYLGTPREQLPALIIAALERGRVVGYSGRDRPVYEVDIGDGPRRIAITVSSNGYIVGAHPIPLDQVLRQHRDRSKHGRL
ncbi:MULTISPECIES: hypothetical protein [Actinoalloteichus]|uniref:Uncharacterized protein n=1 Tax=Actinoalloteichus fjordicus TaxID=1612552 RepID=A0AAC9PQ46_9PSEU|nr:MULTISPECIES: hypothetical protein [Actinoalloteichus]APU12695.1 hypothetical protein UA74_03060 [Actinoalloteichus fjordicus]APU18665.1 hypothetical protein UA75_03150 [Actinoalloteichus sp. GBA129-24]